MTMAALTRQQQHVAPRKILKPPAQALPLPHAPARAVAAVAVGRHRAREGRLVRGEGLDLRPLEPRRVLGLARVEPEETSGDARGVAVARRVAAARR